LWDDCGLEAENAEGVDGRIKSGRDECQGLEFSRIFLVLFFKKERLAFFSIAGARR